MSLLEELLKYWPLAAALLGLVVWLVRLEAKAMSNAKEVRRLWSVRAEDRDNHDKHRVETNRKLDRIADDIKEMGRTLTADIKHLLERGKK